MFETFYQQLRFKGIPISLTAFLRLQKALSLKLVNDLEDFYIVARALMVKSEKHFDLYDKCFAEYFLGKGVDDRDVNMELEDDAVKNLIEWLMQPENLALLSPEEQDLFKNMSIEELEEYFRKRLEEQDGAHHGGNYWIGTGGTSPVGHGGHHPGGMRIGGIGGGRSAIKVALSRRYESYAAGGMLRPDRIGDGLAQLKLLKADGPKDKVDIDETIRETVKQAGEITLVMASSLRDRLKVILAMDNGGWSMHPFVPLCRSLFTSIRGSFKDLTVYYYHNCIYDNLWLDEERQYRPVAVREIVKQDADTRFIIVGDASMAPWELHDPRGQIEYGVRQSMSGRRWLEAIGEHFSHSVWVNPIPENEWGFTYGSNTIYMIGQIFPMVELSENGLAKAVEILKGK